MDTDIWSLGIALGLGLLVGLQRERTGSRVAGLRTFGLVSLLGALSGLVARHFNHIWLIAAGLIALAILLGVANLVKKQKDESDVGQTTEIALLLMYVIGSYLMMGKVTIGVVAGAAVAILLYLRDFFAEHVPHLSEKDLRAIMVFVAVSLVVLPILPAHNFGPYQVLNLREIWLMVVLIVGLGVIGYFLYKWAGRKLGTSLNGVLGGLTSSTATTVSYARMTKLNPPMYWVAGFVITAASTMSFARIILEILVVAPNYIDRVGPPLLTVFGFMAVVSIGMFFAISRHTDDAVYDPENPAQLRTALIFGILYTVVLVLIVFAKESLGSEGLYTVAILSGLTDVDAITLSIANMLNSGRIAPDQGWRLILIAGLSNLVFKAGVVMVLGERRLLHVVIPMFLALISAGLVVLWVW